MTLKIGLIARCEYARGLAIQCKGFYDHLPVERVLLVRMPRLDCEERTDWYPGATHITYDSRDHCLNQREVMQWMEGLDVVFTVETPYDWRLPTWARVMGVKTVVQGNPEFYRHDLPEGRTMAQPDKWWWPTRWRLDHLPEGQVMPVPMPDVKATVSTSDRLRIFHIAGKRAYGDRNGTDVFVSMLNALRCDVDVTAFGLDYSLPEMPKPRGWTLRVENAGVADRWEMYDNQDVLVLPRRYGGLCLPALEAASRGVAVMMPNCSPNEQLAQLHIDARRVRRLSLPAGSIDCYDVNHLDLARDIADLNLHPDKVAHAKRRALRDVPRWSTWRQVYLDEFERLCG